MSNNRSFVHKWVEFWRLEYEIFSKFALKRAILLVPLWLKASSFAETILFIHPDYRLVCLEIISWRLLIFSCVSRRLLPREFLRHLRLNTSCFFLAVNCLPMLVPYLLFQFIKHALISPFDVWGLSTSECSLWWQHARYNSFLFS